MSRFSRRFIVIGGVVLLVAAAIGLTLRPRPVPVDFAPVVRGDLTVTVDDEGETRLKDVYVVSAPVRGRVLRIDIEVGDTIQAGETVLAIFEPSDPAILDVRSRSEAESEVSAAEAAIQLAVAERERASAELAFAESELKRKKPLAKRGTISAADFDRTRLEVNRARAAVAEARANVEVKRSQLEMARAALITAPGMNGGSPDSDDRFTIPVRAPINGRVMRILQESEAVVEPGTPILEVGDQSRLEIVVDLLSTDAVKVTEGDPVWVEEWGGPKALSGVVRRVEPFGFTKVSALGIEEQRVNVIVDLIAPHDEWRTLGHGYHVETRIVTDQRANVLKIPVSALFRVGETWSVFINRDFVARLQAVELGQRNSLEAEVVSGLSAGELVILHSSDRIADGVALEARPAP